VLLTSMLSPSIFIDFVHGQITIWLIISNHKIFHTYLIMP
jgi:hypothetical protein